MAYMALLHIEQICSAGAVTSSKFNFHILKDIAYQIDFVWYMLRTSTRTTVAYHLENYKERRNGGTSTISTSSETPQPHCPACGQEGQLGHPALSKFSH